MSLQNKAIRHYSIADKTTVLRGILHGMAVQLNLSKGIVPILNLRSISHFRTLGFGIPLWGFTELAGPFFWESSHKDHCMLWLLSGPPQTPRDAHKFLYSRRAQEMEKKMELKWKLGFDNGFAEIVCTEGREYLPTSF